MFNVFYFEKFLLGKRVLCPVKIGVVFKRRLTEINSINKFFTTQWPAIASNRTFFAVKQHELRRIYALNNVHMYWIRLFSKNSFVFTNKQETSLRMLSEPARTGYSPWIAFLRESFKKTSGNFKEITKQCSNIWKTMSQEERQVYEDMSLRSKLQAARTYKHWVTSLSPKEIVEENRLRNQLKKQGKKNMLQIKDPRKPKRPATSFLLYCAYARSRPDFVEKYAEGETKLTNQMKILSKNWAIMGDEEKKEFIDKAMDNKARYQRELEIYQKL
ncbi:hypothetical protein PORY_001813 [Pneumocystis oryctolagi]|uniref:Uncharacterized protein n=1 Tax=Pneumocystis oryctolagi TaxID=42067 RepID=A0ACB7CBB7_9ASCO|nr:hypothetical protein PORY_001813 [Pneumocystis oryctolagi]